MGQGGVSGPIASYSKEMSQLKIPSMSQDQIQRLLNLINTPKAGFKKLSSTVSWMLDSDAPCHMAGDISMMDKIEKNRACDNWTFE